MPVWYLFLLPKPFPFFSVFSVFTQYAIENARPSSCITYLVLTEVEAEVQCSDKLIGYSAQGQVPYPKWQWRKLFAGQILETQDIDFQSACIVDRPSYTSITGVSCLMEHNESLGDTSTLNTGGNPCPVNPDQSCTTQLSSKDSQALARCDKSIVLCLVH